MKKKYLVFISLILIIFIIYKYSSNNLIVNKIDNNNANVSDNIKSDTWTNNIKHPFNWIDISTELKNSFKDSVIWENIDNYWNIIEKIKPTEIDNWKIWDKKNSFKIELYGILIENKAITKDDILLCDTNKLWNKEAIQKCKWKYFMFKLIKDKDINICDNFKNDLNYWFILNSNLWNNQVCKKFYSLLINTKYTDSDIRNFANEINSQDKGISYYELLTILSKKNNCNKINTMNSKLWCYQFVYLNNYEDKFNSEIMPDIANSKYLYWSE